MDADTSDIWENRPPMQIGLQLFTVRDYVKTAEGLRDSLHLAKKIGYAGVQFSAVAAMDGEAPAVTAADAKMLLDETGLKAVVSHRPWERFEKHFEEEVEFHQALGCRHAAISVPPPWAPEGGLDGFKWLADWMNDKADRLAKHGIGFGYHNHAVEFQRLGPKGERPFGVLAKRCERSVFFLLDIYWAVHAGVDVLALIGLLPKRMPIVHVKDKAVYGWDVDFAPVGEGNLPWGRIFPALKEAGTEWLLVEQDTCRRDVWESVEASFKYLDKTAPKS
jgi:sugar phosphate isomerase/epimerase